MREGWARAVFFGVIVAMGLVGALTPARAQQQPAGEFPVWLEGVRSEAAGKGIRQETIDAALGDVQPIDRVLELDHKQPEFQLGFDDYLARTVSEQRVGKGRAALDGNKRLLAAIAAKYGVPARVIVAMWGIESDFGRLTGTFPVVPALATLAYDGRRSQYFRGELLNALVMIDKGRATSGEMLGSWAGAMGQCQFMPSTYLKYAQAWNGGGKPDIWNTPADVFASTAHYLSSLGWKTAEGWGMPILLPPHGIAPILVGLDRKRTMREWRKLGLRRVDGRMLPNGSIKASLIFAEPAKADGTGPASPFLVFDNFRVLMKWNRSIFFAVAAGTLADKIASR